MIIGIVVLLAALMIAGFFYLKGALGNIVGTLAAVLLALSMLGLIYHDTDHWGMKQVTTTTTREIYSLSGSDAAYGLLVKSEIGTDSSNYMFMYKSATDDTKATVNFVGNTKNVDMTSKTATNSVSSWVKDILKNETVETSKKSATYAQGDFAQAQITTQTTRWEWDSALAQAIFGVGGEQGDLVSEKVTVDVPKDTWLVLTTAQVQKLESSAAALKAAAEKQAQADPQAALAMQTLAKTDPSAYAKLQVAQIKQFLGLKE
ncbi:MAG: DUF4811 domain-containing protein [Streptococcaceae bacterium]|jgi:hypothetical protein|nr:DUF4811 domain-containing protein [Streptococcaceae bacterium]